MRVSKLVVSAMIASVQVFMTSLGYTPSFLVVSSLLSVVLVFASHGLMSDSLDSVCRVARNTHVSARLLSRLKLRSDVSRILLLRLWGCFLSNPSKLFLFTFLRIDLFINIRPRLALSLQLLPNISVVSIRIFIFDIISRIIVRNIFCALLVAAISSLQFFEVSVVLLRWGSACFLIVFAPVDVDIVFVHAFFEGSELVRLRASTALLFLFCKVPFSFRSHFLISLIFGVRTLVPSFAFNVKNHVFSKIRVDRGQWRSWRHVKLKGVWVVSREVVLILKILFAVIYKNVIFVIHCAVSLPNVVRSLFLILVRLEEEVFDSGLLELQSVI